ncbi:MAG TPA: SH3 domain-containing protein, partial [Usitatibacter sp.]|nr:SH3 domain-containing protein [Usitatibacter sp.]
MRYRRLAALVLAAFAWAAFAAEQGFTNRATELKERGSADSPTLATLPENTPVNVIERGGAWTHVEAGGKPGWVRVFHLRFPAVVEASAASGSGFASLGSALGLGGKSDQARLATTGIRGLTSEDVKNA